MYPVPNRFNEMMNVSVILMLNQLYVYLPDGCTGE